MIEWKTAWTHNNENADVFLFSLLIGYFIFFKKMQHEFVIGIMLT